MENNNEEIFNRIENMKKEFESIGGCENSIKYLEIMPEIIKKIDLYDEMALEYNILIDNNMLLKKEIERLNKIINAILKPKIHGLVDDIIDEFKSKKNKIIK